jgi:cytochrome c
MDELLMRSGHHIAIAPSCWRIVAALALLAGSAPGLHAQTDLKRAAGLFATHCSECHSVKEGKDKKGPSLFGIVGRRAAQVSGFVYSDALKQSGLSWTPDVLDRYLVAPATAVPGGKMKYDGAATAPERTLIIEYLGTFGHAH